MYGFHPKSPRLANDGAAVKTKERKFADGGKVGGMKGFDPKLFVGPGTGISDDIETQFPQGGFVMPADSTAAVGAENLAELGKNVDVNVSNGEMGYSPEQIYMIGLETLRQIKDATHTPAAIQAQQQGIPEARGFDLAEAKKYRGKSGDNRARLADGDRPEDDYWAKALPPDQPQTAINTSAPETFNPADQEKSFASKASEYAPITIGVVGEQFDKAGKLWDKGNYAGATARATLGAIAAPSTITSDLAGSAAKGIGYIWDKVTEDPYDTPATQPAEQPAAQPATQPAEQPATQPAAQPDAQPAAQPAAPLSAKDANGVYTTESVNAFRDANGFENAPISGRNQGRGRNYGEMDLNAVNAIDERANAIRESTINMLDRRNRGNGTGDVAKYYENKAQQDMIKDAYNRLNSNSLVDQKMRGKDRRELNQALSGIVAGGMRNQADLQRAGLIESGANDRFQQDFGMRLQDTYNKSATEQERLGLEKERTGIEKQRAGDESVLRQNQLQSAQIMQKYREQYAAEEDPKKKESIARAIRDFSGGQGTTGKWTAGESMGRPYKINDATGERIWE
ncbi:MAG: PT domain-containing protein [Zoogloeaceae bacterium]|jgi:hypothetical protein|nr:PT domain-containing protein [Zoogloeaceae bacterium]